MARRCRDAGVRRLAAQLATQIARQREKENAGFFTARLGLYAASALQIFADGNIFLPTMLFALVMVFLLYDLNNQFEVRVWQQDKLREKELKEAAL